MNTLYLASLNARPTASFDTHARVAELVDALDLKSNWHLNASVGSSPTSGTLQNPKLLTINSLGYFYVTMAKQKVLFSHLRME